MEEINYVNQTIKEIFLSFYYFSDSFLISKK